MYTGEPNLPLIANNLRVDIIEMLYEAGSGHPGGSLSCADILTSLYFGGVLGYDRHDPEWEERDRVIVSKGHAAPALYAVLADIGYISRQDLTKLRKTGASLKGHPHYETPGVEVSTGSLGQGLSIALGKADTAKIKGQDWRVYCLMGDGEIQEGQVWEAAMNARRYDMDNLCGIIDHNGLQIDGEVSEISGLYPIAEKWRAFGWHVIGEEVRMEDRDGSPLSGHDFDFLASAFEEARRTPDKPSVIIADTTKGKGVSYMEDAYDWHGKPLGEEQYVKAMTELAEARRRLGHDEL